MFLSICLSTYLFFAFDTNMLNNSGKKIDGANALVHFMNQLIHQDVLSCLLQEEYQAEGITWHNIDYTDNVGCIHLISKKPTGLLYLLDEESK